jgi:dihydroxyacetone kinase-like protein
MNGQELRVFLDRALERFASSAEELRDLDAALGDGDLGITISAATRGAREALTRLTPDSSPSDVLFAIAPAIANANPSTFAALAAGALIAGARTITDANNLGRDEILRLGRSAAAAIGTRGEAAVGDKTVLDAIVPSLDAAEAWTGDPASTLEVAIRAATRGVDDTAKLISRRGRASWIGERGRGHPDPGATAYVRFLEAMRSVMLAGEPPTADA